MSRTWIQPALESIIRSGLTFLAGWLVSKGVWTDGAASVYVAGGTIALMTAGWGVWDKRKAYARVLLALWMRQGSTYNDLQAAIKSGAPIPALNTPPNTPPGVPMIMTEQKP